MGMSVPIRFPTRSRFLEPLQEGVKADRHRLEEGRAVDMALGGLVAAARAISSAATHSGRGTNRRSAQSFRPSFNAFEARSRNCSPVILAPQVAGILSSRFTSS